MRPTNKKIDLGLAISGATLPPGQCRQLREIAAFCGCTDEAIAWIERRALKKIRKAIYGGRLKHSLSLADIPNGAEDRCTPYTLSLP